MAKEIESLDLVMARSVATNHAKALRIHSLGSVLECRLDPSGLLAMLRLIILP